MQLIQNLRDCMDTALVGGKAANLGALLRAGFVVPDGFVMTTAAQDVDISSIRSAYRNLGAETVAVRSSATTEDRTDLSMAGQFRTILNVRTESELLDAVQLCRAGSKAPNVLFYLSENKVTQGGSMAVMIQRQVPADAAGVLFTQAPGNANEMLVEAAVGLGDRVVSGDVQPDRYRLNAETGQVIETKSDHETRSLTVSNLRQLWELGRKVASHFGTPQDIEWAISRGKLFLLQSRPITTSEREPDRLRIVEATRDRLAKSEGGPWLLHNLAETAPHPTPLTWSILRRFMSGAGGFGSMYRRLGFDPAPGEFLELIAGKIYMDLSRAPGLFGRDFPFSYDLRLLRGNPDHAQLPPSIPNGSWKTRFHARRRMRAAQDNINQQAKDFDNELRSHIIPEFTKWCATQKECNLASLSNKGWIDLWHERESRIFDRFAPQILFTNFIAASALDRLRDFVAEHFWDESPEIFASTLASTGQPNHTILADTALRGVARGELPLETWIASHGHRAVNELDLATPRWRETPDLLLAYLERLKDAPDPVELHREKTAKIHQWIDQLPPRTARRLKQMVLSAQRYLSYREEGKHYFMLGYDLLRDMVLDASRRLDADVVWFTFDELANSLCNGSVPRATAHDRLRAFRAESRIHLPSLIVSTALDCLGQAPTTEPGEHSHGLAISSGFASGPVRIVQSPLELRDLGKGYVLVCPSTDPQWTPLFLNASALVVECGGILSHGAIVAREMNLPAVVLPDATRQFRDGDQIAVDGLTGIVSRNTSATNLDSRDEPLRPVDLPPPSGRIERRAARLRTLGFGCWGVFLIAAWSLPEDWLYQPALHAFDRLLWPIVSTCGKPLAVVAIAAGLALIAALTQKLIVDNKRMREVRRRSRNLLSRATVLPKGSRQRELLISTAHRAYRRIMGAGFVPIGMLLGLFVLSFIWLQQRMSATNPLPGSAAIVLAKIDSNFREPITLSVDPPLHLDTSSPATRSLPPIRETLERLLSQKSLTDSDQTELRTYLNRGVPPQTLAWVIQSDQSGSFPIHITFPQGQSLSQFVVFGESAPPPDVKHFRDREIPARSITIQNDVRSSGFWNIGTILPGLDQSIDWPWIYLAAYLMVWLVLHRAMRLA